MVRGDDVSTGVGIILIQLGLEEFSNYTLFNFRWVFWGV